MGKQAFNRVNKISNVLGVLLLVFFILSMTAASASAESVDTNYQIQYFTNWIRKSSIPITISNI